MRRPGKSIQSIAQEARFFGTVFDNRALLLRVEGDGGPAGRVKKPSGSCWDGFMLLSDTAGQEIEAGKASRGRTSPVPLQLSG